MILKVEMMNKSNKTLKVNFDLKIAEVLIKISKMRSIMELMMV